MILIVGVIAVLHLASSVSVDPPSPAFNRGLFAADLFSNIAKDKVSENVVFSPVSIQTALSMAYLGAGGETANELEHVLRLGSNNKEKVGESFAQLLSDRSGESKVKIANRIFFNSEYKLNSEFNAQANKYFNSEAEPINVSESSKAVDRVNSWIAEKTNNKISEVLPPGSVDPDTSALIVNAIYFKSKWETEFDKDSTGNKPFWITPSKSVDVPTMYGDEYFKYEEFPELDATALEMPYKDSDLSMLLILPNQKDGLADLESKLSSVALNQLSSKMTERSLFVEIPKFKIEFSTELTPILKKMGIELLFGNADLSGVFKSGPTVKVSDVRHKAYLDVNEGGSEAAAATIMKMVPMSLQFGKKYFKANHPFVFAIKSPEAVYFIGHVAKF